jgi:uncharacterized protein (DUF433 family)
MLILLHPRRKSAPPPENSCYNESDGFASADMATLDRTTFDPQIMGGRACIRGIRVIIGQIAHGATFDEIRDDYPELELEDIRQAIEYAVWLTQEKIHTA